MKVSTLLFDDNALQVLFAIDASNPAVVLIAVFNEGEDTPVVTVEVPRTTVYLFLGGL